uniref:Transporter n=1 Tax=Strigamia maritima TaxID=126957 RepID=T1JNJ2_STRMM
MFLHSITGKEDSYPKSCDVTAKVRLPSNCKSGTGALSPLTSSFSSRTGDMKSKRGHFNLAYINTEPPSVSVIPVPYTPPPSYDSSNPLQDNSQIKRDQWNNQIEFLLSIISMSVGLGNIWRFPFVAFENGGGAFLIPYLIVLVLIGKPLYFMELSLGQFCSYGAVKVWKCVPIFRGIGFSQAVTGLYVVSYYNVIMATCVFYLASCFQSVLPWTYCDSSWGADYLCTKLDDIKNITVTNCTNLSFESIDVSNFTCDEDKTLKLQSSAEQYNIKYVYKMSKGIEYDLGIPDWRMSLCLLLCWTVTFFCLIRGIKSSGRTAYFTAFFPYVVLISLLILGCTLDGIKEGIVYFINPNWDALLNPVVWFKACEQSFFSLTVGFGNLTMFSSYNAFRHNVYKDAIIVSILDTFTSLLAGFTIFAILGSMSHVLKIPIEEVVTSGANLAFVAYPQALARIDVVPQLWSALFFIMLLTLGIGSSVSIVGNLQTMICDEFSNLAKWKACLIISCTAFTIGLIYCTPGGQYVFSLVDTYGGGFTIFVYSLLQVIAIMWVYGIGKYCRDMEFMLGHKMNYYWKICWGFITPVSLLVIFIYSLTLQKSPTLGDYKYPNWCVGLGLGLAMGAFIHIPIWAVVAVYKEKGFTLLEKFRKACKPAADWGPLKTSEQLKAIGCCPIVITYKHNQKCATSTSHVNTN